MELKFKENLDAYIFIVAAAVFVGWVIYTLFFEGG